MNLKSSIIKLKLKAGWRIPPYPRRPLALVPSLCDGNVTHGSTELYIVGFSRDFQSARHGLHSYLSFAKVAPWLIQIPAYTLTPSEAIDQLTYCTCHRVAWGRNYTRGPGPETGRTSLKEEDKSPRLRASWCSFHPVPDLGSYRSRRAVVSETHYGGAPPYVRRFGLLLPKLDKPLNFGYSPFDSSWHDVDCVFVLLS